MSPLRHCLTGHADVWYKNTYGKMTIESVLTGWIDVPQTEAQTAGGNSGMGQTIWTTIKSALSIAEQIGLSQLTNGQVSSMRDFDKNGYAGDSDIVICMESSSVCRPVSVYCLPLPIKPSRAGCLPLLRVRRNTPQNLRDPSRQNKSLPR
jgi:hypothetical protein